MITYTIQVHNSGPGTATGVVVKVIFDNSPRKVSLISSQPKCSPQPGKMTCRLGTMSPGTTTIIYKVKVNHPGTITNIATVKADQRDRTPKDNKSTVEMEARRRSRPGA